MRAYVFVRLCACIPYDQNIADILTKPLGPIIHQPHARPLLHQNPYQVTDHGEYQDPDCTTVTEGSTGDQWFQRTADITTTLGTS